jgi:uncharacterized membrane protein YbhN (UPF0104 family)
VNMKTYVKKTFYILIPLAIFTFCVVYIIQNFRWILIFKQLKETDLVGFILGAGSSIVFYFLLKTLRWFYILRKQDIKVHFKFIYFYSAVSLSVALITPLQMGEIVKVELLKRFNEIPRSQAYSIFLFERVIDFFIVIFVALISLLIFFNPFKGILKIYSVFFILFICLLSIILFKKYGGVCKINEFLNYFKLCFNDIKTLVLTIIFTLFSWLIIALGWQVSLYSISLSIGFFRSLSLMSIATLINIGSLIPGAVGVSEVGISEILYHFDANSVSSKAGALILRVYGLFTMFLGLIHYLIWMFLNRMFWKKS